MNRRNQGCSKGIVFVESERFRGLLLTWFDLDHRDLPWRGESDPYAIWVSETMLQQTRVEVVRTRYRPFLQRFPDLKRLASAPEEEVVAAWSGLGYYRRARNLHAAAVRIVCEHGWSFPNDLHAASALPGIGRYTARAVLSIAYGARLAVVDGNVSRVLSRLELLPARPGRRVQEEADRLLDPARPGDANQALMELGATICLPENPRCDRCPVAILCAARRAGRVTEFPPVRKREPSARIETTIWIVRDRRGRYWLEHREAPPLSGLWMLPWREGRSPVDEMQSLGTVSHAIMNRRYRCELFPCGRRPALIPGPAAGPGRWTSPWQLDLLPHPSLLRKALALIERRRKRS